MLSQDIIQFQGSVSRPGTANNLPGSLAPKPGWGHPVMKLAKLIGWQYALQRAGSEARLILHKDWECIGVRAVDLLMEVRRLLGGAYDQAWSEQGRVDSESRKASDLMNRVYHMYTEHQVEGKTKVRVRLVSKEHPLRSRKLLPFVPKAIEIFTAGKAVSLQLIEENF